MEYELFTPGGRLGSLSASGKRLTWGWDERGWQGYEGHQQRQTPAMKPSSSLLFIRANLRQNNKVDGKHLKNKTKLFAHSHVWALSENV